MDSEDVEIIESFILGFDNISDCQSNNNNYTYSWFGNNGFISYEEDIFDVSGGTYTLTVTDQNDCSTSEVFEISEDAGITICLLYTSPSPRD